MRKSLWIETTNENKKFLHLWKLVSNYYLIKQSFQGYRCVSGIVIFAWSVTENYTYSHFKSTNKIIHWVITLISSEREAVRILS